MISHDNIIFETSCVIECLKHDLLYSAHEERVLSFLPLSHVAGMMVDIVTPIVAAARTPGWVHVHVARPYDLSKGTLADRLRAVQPTLFLGVPRVWEKIMEKILATLKRHPVTGIKRKIADFGKSIGLRFAQNCQLGQSGYKPFGYWVSKTFVAGKLKKMLGLTHCKFAFTGAAPITEPTLHFFGMLGVQINEVSICCGGVHASKPSMLWCLQLLGKVLSSTLLSIVSL